MNKYIDAEKLIAEIERYKQGAAIARFDNAGENSDYFQGKVDLCNDLTHIIASLQQDKDVLDLCSQVWWEDRGWIMIPPNVTLKGIENLLERVRHKIKWNEKNGIKEQEQQEVDLEKEIIRYQREDMDRDTTVRDVARHFYELGLNAKK